MIGTRRDSLHEYCERMSMSYSYKPVLILSVLSNDGTESLDDAANYFLSFYGRRLELGLVSEKRNSIYSNLKCSFELVKQNIRQNPIKALTNSSNFFSYDRKSDTFGIVPEYWQTLQTSDKVEIAAACNDRLDSYFAAVTQEQLNDIVCFSKPENVNGFLSSDFKAPFSLHGESFLSVSQYLLFRRSALTNDGKRMRQILSMGDVERITETKVFLPKELEQIWAGQKQLIVYKAQIAKYAQNGDLCEQLLDTGSSILAACLPQDAIWGNGLEIGDAVVGDPKLWPGQNLLGFSLMQARSALCSTRQF